MENIVEPIRKKIVTNATQRAALLSAFYTSGLSQKAFAAREGVNYHTFISWLVRRRREAESLPPTGHLVGSATFGRLEVTLPGQIIVRGDDAESVAKLVHSLRQGAEVPH